MIAFSAAVEPLRLANRLSDSDLYSGKTLSMDGAEVTASNGVSVMVDAAVTDGGPLDMLIVCAGINVREHTTGAMLNAIRRRSSHGTGVGALCTGTYVLAKAGLLDEHRCTIHWENLMAFVEEFPDLTVTSELFEIDRNRFSCAGGTAAADMMLTLIAMQQGESLAASVADQLIHHRIREGHERQRMELRARLGVAHPKLISVVQMMEENIEEPLSCTELARDVGLSARQLERLFRKYMGQVPTRYYLELRLKRARFLLLQTSMPVLSVALSCGFVSASHFSKCYREHFRRTPSEERRGLKVPA